VTDDLPERATDQSILGAALDGVAQLRLGEGNWKEACELFDQAASHHEAARRSNPNHRVYRQRLADHWRVRALASYHQNDFDAADKALERAKALRGGADSSDRLVLAMVRWKSGDAGLARELYREAVGSAANESPDGKFHRLQGEAAALLGIK